MGTRFIRFACVLCLSTTGWALESPPRNIALNDLLNVTIQGEPDLSGKVKVVKGSISLPLLKETIRVDGLSAEDAQALIADAYKREKILLNPMVTVTMRGPESTRVKVEGAVSKPLTFDIDGEITLSEALARAGGMTATSGNIVIMKPTGNTVVPVRGLLDGEDQRYNVKISGGEDIRVSPGAR
jgi:protein involved in polysaccharide export with SLBB domain